MKKFLLILLTLLLALSLFSCDTEDASEGVDDTPPTAEGNDAVVRIYDVKFRMPGQSTLFIAKGQTVDGAAGINLSSDSLKNDDYFKNGEFRGYSFTEYTHRSTYLGLFSEPDGGVICFDADGKNVSGGYAPTTGIYYARFDRGSIPITYGGIDDPAAYGLPTSVKYGAALGVTSLPVIEKEGHEFLRWELSVAWGLEVTNKYGEILGNYLTVTDGNYSSVLTSKSGIYFYPVYEEIAPETDITLTLIYNDGTQRVKYKEWSSRVRLRESSLPTSNGALKTLKGWSLTPDGNEPFEGYLTEDTTLYAIWTARRYICVSTVAGDETLYEVVEGEITRLPTPERDGYVFTGWYVNELRTGLPVSGEVEYSHPYEYYYAGWEKTER